MPDKDLTYGDRVRIIEYGHIVNMNDDVEILTKDSMPELIGREGFIVNYNVKTRAYTLLGVVGKASPFYRDQLEKI